MLTAKPGTLTPAEHARLVSARQVAARDQTTPTPPNTTTKFTPQQRLRRMTDAQLSALLATRLAPSSRRIIEAELGRRTLARANRR
jgi:hypothetical protein